MKILSLCSVIIAGLALFLAYGCEKEDEPILLGIAAGYGHSMALRSDGSLWVWGYNNSNQLGDGTSDSRTTPFSLGTGYSNLAAGGAHSLAIKSDESLWAWGSNQDGQLGDGT